jgi:hypothetical protein
MPVDFEKFSFGSMQIDGRFYDFDLITDRGEIRKLSTREQLEPY